MKSKVINMFLDWFNNFLTVQAFADYYGISRWRALRVIELGRLLHNRKIEKGF